MHDNPSRVPLFHLVLNIPVNREDGVSCKSLRYIQRQGYIVQYMYEKYAYRFLPFLVFKKLSQQALSKGYPFFEKD